MVIGMVEPAAQEVEQEVGLEDTRVITALHDEWPGERSLGLIERGRQEGWSSDELIAHLELDGEEACHDFGNRAYLVERQERWKEAVWLLAKIDEEALWAWVFGLQSPPRIAQAEVEKQLHCMIRDMVRASRMEESQIRLFPVLSEHFGGSIRSLAELVARVERSPRWLNRTVTALNRSLFRDMGAQSFIWHRKFVFRGRSFNLVSEEAGQLCGIQPGQTWKPDHPTHVRCWQERLTPVQREQEILIASAAPGVSRHHWGTDVDILGLNPRLFVEGGPLYHDWRWLDRQALDYGFFQPYGGNPELRPAHFEERWHWSYFPIGQALWEFVYAHQEEYEAELFRRWDRYERRWGMGRGPFFDYMREHWRAYLFHIDRPVLEAVTPVVGR